MTPCPATVSLRRFSCPVAPTNKWAVMFLGLDRFHRINNVLGYPMSKDVDEPSVNPKRDGEPHEH